MTQTHTTTFGQSEPGSNGNIKMTLSTLLLQN